ncbi:MAG: alpha/beta fold hydrolase [Lysobacterales bacterium]
MTKAKRTFIDGDYGQIHLRFAGPDNPSQTPLVLLHMFPQSGRNFSRLIEVVSETRIAVAPDFPGHGESCPPPVPIAAEQYATAIWQVVDQLDLLRSHGKVNLFGIHAGAKLAVAATRQRPEHVGALILSSAATLSSDDVTAIRQSMTPAPLDDDGTRFKDLWRMVASNSAPEMSLPMKAESLAEIVRWNQHYGWGSSAVFDYNERFIEAIESLPHPVTLLNPGDDLYKMTPRTLGHLKNGTLIDLPDWNHGYLDYKTNDVAQVIESALLRMAA